MNKAKTIRAGDIDVAYHMEGDPDAPVIMLAHGLMTSHRLWDDMISALGGKWRVLRYDLRGHGSSQVSPAPYTVASLARDSINLMDALAIEKVHFVGTSLGGMIGQYLGARHGNRLLTLTVANTTATQGASSAWQDRITLAREQGLSPLVEPTLARWFTAQFLKSGSARIEQTRDTVRSTAVEGFIGCASAVRDLAQVGLLTEIEVPILVVVGTEDQTTPASEGQAIHAAVRGSRLVALPAAHQAAIEQPEAFAVALENFLQTTNRQEKL